MARHTSDPLLLPGRPSGQTVRARRWRDLVRQWHDLLGPARASRPDVRVKLSGLIALTLLLEELEAAVARGDPVDPNHVIQGTQQVNRIVSELAPPPPPTAPEQTLEEYVACAR